VAAEELLIAGERLELDGLGDPGSLEHLEELEHVPALGERRLGGHLLDAGDQDREHLARREVVLDHVLPGLDAGGVALPHRVEPEPAGLLDQPPAREQRRDRREAHAALDLELDVLAGAGVRLAGVRQRPVDQHARHDADDQQRAEHHGERGPERARRHAFHTSRM
jgi:hypothetical protein